MRAGRLRNRILLRIASGTLDSHGERRGGTVYAYSGPYSAGVMPMTGRERMESAQVTQGLTHNVTMRGHHAIESGSSLIIDSTAPDIEVVLQADDENTLRNLFSSRVLDVDSAVDVDERGHTWRMVCKEKVRN